MCNDATSPSFSWLNFQNFLPSFRRSRRSFSQPAFRSFCSRLIRRWAVSYARSISSCLPRRLFLAGEHAFSPELPFLPFQERDKCRLMDESWGFNGTPPVIRITAWLLLSSSVRNFIPPRAYTEFSRPFPSNRLRTLLWTRLNEFQIH